MKNAEIRKIVDEALAHHRCFGGHSEYAVRPEVALEQAIQQATGEFVKVGLINGAATVENMMASAREALRKPVGAPPKMQDGKRTNVYLSAESRAIAERVGGGNVSEGIRIALERSSLAGALQREASRCPTCGQVVKESKHVADD